MLLCAPHSPSQPESRCRTLLPMLLWFVYVCFPSNLHVLHAPFCSLCFSLMTAVAEVIALSCLSTFPPRMPYTNRFGMIFCSFLFLTLATNALTKCTLFSGPYTDMSLFCPLHFLANGIYRLGVAFRLLYLKTTTCLQTGLVFNSSLHLRTKETKR